MFSIISQCAKVEDYEIAMTSIIKVHALSGALDESPPCYILQLDEFRFLLDCGWNETFDEGFMKELKKHIPQIDAVLLSYPDVLHLGALPYIVGKCGLSCPIYATIPVYKMGQMFMYDLYQSRHNMEDFDLFTLDDVDAAFDKIIQLKYNQSVPLKGKGYGITITPLPAGHIIGGSIWKIVKVGEEDIIYAVDYNHKKERHLNGCELEKISRPSLLITDTFNAVYQQARRRIRDEKLMTNILQTLRGGGNVLITVDTAGRVLELIHMLDQLWRNKDSGLIAYSLALLNNVSYNVVEFAKSQIEWMSDKLMKSFEGARNNPFQFKHVQLCHSLAELNKVPSPKVVLASTPDMECGFSRELFLQWAPKAVNSIIITNRSPPGTLARQLLEMNETNKTMQLLVKRRVRLEGEELQEFQKKERQETFNKLKTSNDFIELSSDSEDDDISNVVKGKHDLMIKSSTQKQQVGFFKSNKKRYPMFPFYEEKIKYDDYGEIIKMEDFKAMDFGHDSSDKNLVDDDDMMIVDISEVPTKCTSSTRSVTVEAQVQFIDFEGRSDGESIQKIIANMKPRRLILVRGSEESTQAIFSHCKQYTDAKIYAPKCGDVIDVTMETHIYQVRLTDALLSSLDFKMGKDAEVAWLNGRISTKNKKRRAKIEDKNKNDSEESPEDEEMPEDDVFNLEPIPVNEITGHQPVFINELKLSDFKQVLTKHQIPTDVLGGVLYCCNGTVAVRRIETGKVILEGCLSENYYKIRKLLYEQYAII